MSNSDQKGNEEFQDAHDKYLQGFDVDNSDIPAVGSSVKSDSGENLHRIVSNPPALPPPTMLLSVSNASTAISTVNQCAVNFATNTTTASALSSSMITQSVTGRGSLQAPPSQYHDTGWGSNRSKRNNSQL